MEINRAQFLRLAGSAVLQGMVPRPAFASVPAGLSLPGVNLSGAEIGGLTKKINFGYVYPDKRAYKHYADLGFRLIRLPFRLERIQREPGGELSAEIAELDRAAAETAANGLMLVLDPHNYGQRQGQPILADDLADFWRRIAERYKTQAHIAYGLMNEPKVYKPDAWRPVADASVRAIRSTGSNQLIMVPGGVWTGAHNWLHANAAAFDGFTDGNFMIEVHQYLDQDSSGTHLQEYTAGAGGTRLRQVTEWARERKMRLFLGEFGFALPAGETEARALVQYMYDNADVWAAYAYWAGGPWWGDYAFSAEPRGGVPNPQVALLQTFFR